MHKLRELRAARGWSQHRLALEMAKGGHRCSQSSIDRYERREAIPGRAKMARLLAIFAGDLQTADFYAPPPAAGSAEAAA